MKRYIVFVIGLSLLGSLLSTEYDEEIIYDISAAFLDKSGYNFEVIWFYRLDEESWEGEGNLKVYGKDYLSLNLPFMEVLIQKSVISVKYPEEDQVLIDYFNRSDPSNIFAVILSEFDGFIISGTSILNEKIEVTLVPETLVGFDVLKITVKKNEWIPQTIHAVSGEEMEVSIEVLSVDPLPDRENLKSVRLEAGEIIDLRE